MFNKGQILPCLSLPPLPAHTDTGGSCTMFEAPSKSPTVTQRGLCYGSRSQFQHQAHSLQTQAWKQKSREPWQSTRGTNEEEREEKTALRADQGCSQCQCKLCSGQTAVLAPAVNAREQGLLFCPFAKCLTHAHREPWPDGGLRGGGRQERQPVIQQHC